MHDTQLTKAKQLIIIEDCYLLEAYRKTMGSGHREVKTVDPHHFDAAELITKPRGSLA